MYLIYPVPLLFLVCCTVRVPSPIPVAVRTEAWVYGHSLAVIAGSNPAGGHGCLFIVSIVCCQIEVCAQG